MQKFSEATATSLQRCSSLRPKFIQTRISLFSLSRQRIKDTENNSRCYQSPVTLQVLITCHLLPEQLLTVHKFKPLHGHLIKLSLPPMITYLVMRGTLGTLAVALFFPFVVISIDILINCNLKKILLCICYRQKGSLSPLLNARFSSLGI